MSEQTDGVFIAILAAGASRRMGQQKLLLPVADGKPMVRHVAEVAFASGSDGVIVVTREGAKGKVASVLDGLPVTNVENRHAGDGQSTSMHVAVREVQRQNGTAVIFLLGDEPEIRVDAIEAMLAAYRARQPRLAQVKYRDGFGHPVLFSAPLFDELLACIGDEGGRKVVTRHRDSRLVVPVDALRPQDIDTLDAYEALLARNPRWGE